MRLMRGGGGGQEGDDGDDDDEGEGQDLVWGEMRVMPVTYAAVRMR